MSIVDHHGEVEYPFSMKTVFKAIMEAAPNINGLDLDSADEMSGRVTFKAGVSLASWGENIPVQLIQVSPIRTQMKILSTPKTGVMFGGAMDFGKNQQNINKIINAVSSVLSKYPSEKTDVNNVDFSEQLLKLKQLLDKGILTEEEYAEQKKKILNGEASMATTEPVSSNLSSYPQGEAPIRIVSENEGNSTNYALIALIVFVVIFFLLMMAGI